jgi:signal transduction histidine kinase
MKRRALDASPAAAPGEGRLRWSLRRKLVLLMLSAVLVPLVGLGALAYVVAVRQETDTALRQLDSLAAVQKARVQQVIYQNFEVDLSLVQHDSLLIDLLARFEASGSAADRAALADQLSALEASAPIIHNVVVLTTGGVVVVASHLPTETTQLSRFVGGLAGLSGNVLGPLILDDTGILVHAMVGPMFHDGINIGSVVVETTTLDFLDLVSDYSGLGRTGETMLAMKDPQGDALMITPLRFDPDATLTRRVSRSESDRPIVRALNGEEGVFADTVDYRGQRVFSATRYVPESGWGIVVKMDRSEALAGAATFGWIMLGGLLVIGTIALGAGWLGVRAIRRPVLELTSVADAVAAGDTSTRAPVRSHDEIGTLADAFNKMTSTLVEERATLERRVVERTEALGESARQLEELVRSKADLVASVSHELRTPLTVMVGYVTEVANRWDSFTAEERGELLGIALVQGAELAAIVEDLLVAAQTEAGELTIQAEAVDLGPLVTGVVEHIQLDDRRPIGVGGRSAVVWAEAGRVRQILRNLLSNAVRHGGPTIEVEMVPNGPATHLLVRDDGPGLGHDRVEHIFDMYDRGNAGAGKPGSIGIGLTISRRLARLMGGDLTYRYEAGRSVFDLTLPSAPSHASGPPAG